MKRDWQRGVIFSILLASNKPMSIDEIDKSYEDTVIKYRDKYKLTDKDLSKEEIYSLLIDMIGNQSIKMPDINSFALKTDDDATIDRRIAFDMLRFATSNEAKYSYEDFVVNFVVWYGQEKINKERAFGIFSIAMQNNLIGMMVKPGTRINCLGEVPSLYVASLFFARSSAPAILPLPGNLQPCPPAQ
jgi:hypothetical protein